MLRRILRRIRHRVRQFAGALRPRLDDAARAEADACLEAPQRALFEAMMLRDQQHGIEVLRRVRAAAPAPDPPLFVAALLHDCGKGRVQLWQRVAFVLLEVAAPWLLRRIAVEHGAEWRRPFWRLLHHPELGARLAAEAGAGADTVRMVREQDAKHPDHRLALLQAADDA
ncbi:MAG: hypothetical protein WEC75_06130 [Dehalococcoidia bacterium]